ncbi:hypothetical protein [Paenibacillus ottowii]|uniref:hypothetical protein n=1 Tax=Paenibacillus ottowii TaxID=2315729 RepID=UPI001431744F|nr:hypothetical protein [Paenibacillus ottowii]
MKEAFSKTSLHIDDYLDLLNLAVQVGDTKWQKEITRKLQALSVLQAEQVEID